MENPPPCPVVEWENNQNYIKSKDYQKKLAVVNDATERMIGLIKPIIAKFRKESNLQGALSVTEITRKKLQEAEYVENQELAEFCEA